MEAKVSSRHQVILNRALEICQADQRIVAVFLVGSYVNGIPDEHSDLDLYLITKEGAYADFAAQRGEFMQALGEALFIEDFDLPNIVFLIFSDGSEVEINYVPVSQVGQIFDAPYETLLDKENIAAQVSLSQREVDASAQTEKLRRLIYWFWHNFSHFVTALSRDQLWWASGQLEQLRSSCVNLARLQNDFSDPEIGDEPYFKIEKVLPVEALAPLQSTFCPMEKEALIKAGWMLVDFYKQIAIPLAHSHDIPYPEQLERVLTQKLKS